MKVFHYGTEVGAVIHKGSYIDVDSVLINELAKYNLDLEGFMVENDINYQLIKPAKIIKTYNPTPGLHLHIDWNGWYCPNSGYINGHYFCHRSCDVHGNYIELIHNNQPYYSYWEHLPGNIKPYFAYIWQELEETEYIRFPKKIRIGSKVANLLPDGFRAFKTDDNDQCRVERSKQKYCYIKRYRDCEWYVSPTGNSQLMAKRADSMKGAISEALKMIAEMISNPNHPWNN